MAKNSYVPLPDIDPEQHGILFKNLGFPIGFDEERLLVNVDAVRRTTRMAGLGHISVRGSSGEKSEITPSISGIDSNGTASLGANLTQRNTNLVNGVAVMPQVVQMIVMPDDDSAYYDAYRYAPALIQANVSERDERLRTNKKLKRGLLDPKGHADFLNTVVSNGLREASRQRYRQKDLARLDTAYFYGFTGFNILTAPGHIDSTIRLQGILMGLWAAGNIGARALIAKNSNNEFKDAQFSAMLGQDRRIAAFVLAKTQKFVKASK